MSKSLHSRKSKALREAMIAARKDAGVSQVELAERLKRTQSYVSKVERGERRLELIEFLAWAKIVRADPHALLQIAIEA